MVSFASPAESTMNPQSTSPDPPVSIRHSGSMREKRPRTAKTKLSQDPSVYIDDCPDSPKRQKTRPKERSCRVPVALHPHSSSLANSFFQTGLVYEQHMIKSVAAPTIATLRSMHLDSTGNGASQPSAPQFLQAKSCRQLVTTEVTEKCEELKQSTATESMDDGHIVPISMVPSFARTNKGFEHQVGLPLDDQTSPQTSIAKTPTICALPPVKSRAVSATAQQQEWICENPDNRINQGKQEDRNQKACTSVLDSTRAEKTRAGSHVKQPTGKETFQIQDDSKAAGSDLSLPTIALGGTKQSPQSREGAHDDAADRSTETDSVPRGKDGIVCSRGIRHVPPISAKMVIPVVEVPRIQMRVESQKVGNELHMTHPGNLCGPSESEETRTASLVLQSDCETDDIASSKTLAHSPKPGRDQKFKETQVQEMPDPMIEKLINLDISLNMARKRFDHRSLQVTLDYLLHLPLNFTMLQGCALGQTVNNLRKHDHPDVAKLATILVRLWRWIGGQYLKEVCAVHKHKSLLHCGGQAARSQKKGPRSAKRAPKSAKDLTSIVHRLESVIRDI